MAHHIPIVTPIVFSGTGFAWAGSHHIGSGTIVFTPLTWPHKTEQGTLPTTRKLIHLKSRCAINVMLFMGQSNWRKKMERKVYAGDKDVTFIMDAVDDLTFVTGIVCDVFLPEAKNTTLSTNISITADGIQQIFDLPSEYSAYSFVSASPDNGATWIDATAIQWGSNAPDYNNKTILNEHFSVVFATPPLAGTVLLKIIPVASMVEWPAEIYEKHYIRIHATEIDNIAGWYRLQPRIVSPDAQAKRFETIEMLVSEPGT